MFEFLNCGIFYYILQNYKTKLGLVGYEEAKFNYYYT